MSPDQQTRKLPRNGPPVLSVIISTVGQSVFVRISPYRVRTGLRYGFFLAARFGLGSNWVFICKFSVISSDRIPTKPVLIFQVSLSGYRPDKDTTKFQIEPQGRKTTVGSPSTVQPNNTSANSGLVRPSSTLAACMAAPTGVPGVTRRGIIRSPSARSEVL